jgi:hypothetical protein
MTIEYRNIAGKLKLSPQFQARLASLAPEQTLRSIVLLEAGDLNSSGGKRLSRDERRAVADSVRTVGNQSLNTIDQILEKFGGARLSESVTSLGSIVVESNASGIFSLAASDRVKAVLEDQAISSIQ